MKDAGGEGSPRYATTLTPRRQCPQFVARLLDPPHGFDRRQVVPARRDLRFEAVGRGFSFLFPPQPLIGGGEYKISHLPAQLIRGRGPQGLPSRRDGLELPAAKPGRELW